MVSTVVFAVSHKVLCLWHGNHMSSKPTMTRLTHWIVVVLRGILGGSYTFLLWKLVFAWSKCFHVLQVDAISDYFDDAGPSDLGTSVLISRATLVTKDAVYINKDTCFSLSIVHNGMFYICRERATAIMYLAAVNSSWICDMGPRNWKWCTIQGQTGDIHENISDPLLLCVNAILNVCIKFHLCM